MIKQILTFLAFTVCFSCKHISKHEATFYSKGQTFIAKGQFFISEKGSPYFYLLDDSLHRDISNAVVDSIQFSIRDKLYIATPVRLRYSDKSSKNDGLFYPVKDRSRKIIFDNFDGKKMFTLADTKNLIETLGQPTLIKSE